MVLKQMEPLEDIQNMTAIECGTPKAKKQFAFADGYRNLNHGSFGTYPTALRPLLLDFQDRAEARPDTFIRYEYPKLLDQAREAAAKIIHAPTENCFFVPNATTAFNTVIRNIVFEPGDVIVYFSTIYGACEKTIVYITETTAAEAVGIDYVPPVSDDHLCDAFEKTIQDTLAAGKTPKFAVFDTIISLPGVRMPFYRLTRLCKKYGVLSCVDGAHGIGHIPLDLPDLDPDFFLSNCHKWLYAPRGCCILYVPLRNHDLMRSTLPTSHFFEPLPKKDVKTIVNPLPPGTKSRLANSFEYMGTVNSSPYLCVPAALQWRSKLTWAGKKGEDAIMSYIGQLARQAGKTVSGILGTEILENSTNSSQDDDTLGQCAFTNVRLPLSSAGILGTEKGRAMDVAQWIFRILGDEHNTFIPVMFFGDAWWVRLSAQIYLTLADFEWAAGVLKEVCERVEKGEWAH